MPEILTSVVAQALESPEPGELIELFEVDATGVGGDVYRFAPAPVDGAAPMFDGVAFAVVPFSSEGWEYTGAGPAPTPTLSFRIAREDGDLTGASIALLALLDTLDDLIRARVTRIRTFTRHLDGGADPDPNATFGAEVYEIERIASRTHEQVTVQLRSALDHEGVRLPRRTALGRCGWAYRRHDGAGGFVYDDQVTCPYVGAAMFDLSDQPVAVAALDRCAKRLNSCKLRFGATAELPYGGFPGVGRLRL